MGFGLHLKEILRERGMTIKKLAEVSGISVNTLYSITKRDSLRVDVVILKKIAQALGISVSELTGCVNNKGETDIGLVAIEIAEHLGIHDREAVFEAVSEVIQNQDPFSPEVLKSIRERAKELELQHSIQRSFDGPVYDPKKSINIADFFSVEQTGKNKTIKEISLLLDSLNKDGQREAVKRIAELTEISKYQRIGSLTDEEK